MAVKIPTLFLVALTLFLVSCQSGELERAKLENDSLRMALENQHNVMVVMSDVKSLLDSIDSSRQLLRIDLHEGTPYPDVKSRLEDLNSYVKKTESKIEAIQKEMKSAKHQASAYLMMMDALKDELAIRVDEITRLESAVQQYQEENKGLVTTVKLQEQQVTTLQSQIVARQQELALLDEKVKQMVKNFQVTEAEALFARAQAVEEAANRTRLAPRKKKETYKESLELYKKSLALGKKEAAEAVTRLVKKTQ